MRRDAETNREKLVLAGKRLIQDLGGDVPVELICDRAGVTRGTFYRNFADRAALYEAVLEHEIAAMIAAFAVPNGDPLHFLRLFAEMMIVYDKFLTTLPDMTDYNRDGRAQAKILAAIAPSLRRAQADNAIAADISGDDVMLASRMMASDWRLDGCATRDDAIERRLALMMRGMAPRS